MKEIGKLEIHMGLEYYLFKMGVDMKDIGKKESIMVKEFMKPLLVLSMMGSGNLANIMELEHSSGQMEVYIKENGKTVEKMEKGNLQE